MRAVVQRVRRASVSVAGECVGKIERGLLLLIGIEPSDAQSDIDYIVKKCTQAHAWVHCIKLWYSSHIA